MSRVLASWPYLVAVTVMYLGWLVIAKLPLDAESVRILAWAYAAMLAPFAVAGAGVILGMRHGYEWVTMVACVALFVVLIVVGNLIAFPGSLDITALATAVLGYTVVGNVGIVAALGYKKLDAPIKRSAKG